MSIHLQRELDKLKKDLLLMCSVVEDQVQKAIHALFDRDTELAQEVQAMDDDVDRREINLDEDCLKILALYQPVAIDLRLLVAALKINYDMERIGDMAVNIARKAAALAAESPVEIPVDFAVMGQQTQAMLRNSVDSLVQMDTAMARDVCVRDDEVDLLKKKIRNQIEQQIRQNPQQVGSMLRLLAVSRNLERIADAAVNIAEDVIYMVDGRIVRHQTD